MSLFRGCKVESGQLLAAVAQVAARCRSLSVLNERKQYFMAICKDLRPENDTGAHLSLA